jgi:hypothetical protein
MQLDYVERNRIAALCEEANEYEVVEYQMVITHMVDGAIKKTKSGLVYRLADGRDVHRVTTALFQIVESGKLIQRASVTENRL